jgi:hypothetical protein
MSMMNVDCLFAQALLLEFRSDEDVLSGKPAVPNSFTHRLFVPVSIRLCRSAQSIRLYKHLLYTNSLTVSR